MRMNRKFIDIVPVSPGSRIFNVKPPRQVEVNGEARRVSRFPM
jgi:hypothetical protein